MMLLECDPKRNATVSRHNTLLVSSLTNRFLKFLTRFSGRRRVYERQNLQPSTFKSPKYYGHSHYFRNCKFNIVTTIVLWLLLSTIGVTEACTSRTVPRPRTTTTTTTTAAPATTSRPNITFPTYKCPGDYAKWYCLNGATCFTVQIGVEVLFNCECQDGFMGPRCEYKELEGSYLASRPRVMLEKASIAGGAVAALFLSFVVAFFAYVRWNQNKERESLENGTIQPSNGHATNGHHNLAADVVDGRQQPQVHFSSSQLASSNVRNGDSSELQHPQQHQFQALQILEHHQPLLRPFGPHHDNQKISMSDALLKR